MKFFWCVLIAVVVMLPSFVRASEVSESDIDKVILTEKGGSGTVVHERKKAGRGDAGAEETTTTFSEKRSQRTLHFGSRQGHFRAGLVGPGYAVANKGAGSMMHIAPEGEYFFWEKLSAVMRIWVATDFDDITILSFLPMVRYVFDLASSPRWSLYVQGGVGLALYQGEHAAADIAIPGGGFWWQWTDRWSIGADMGLHILARDQTAVGFTVSPAIRYQF
jgi:hypothetical protein